MRMAKVIYHMKALLPPGTVLDSKPGSSASGEEIARWARKVAQCAKTAAQSLLALCAQHHQAQKGNKPQRRQKPVQPTFYSVERRLRKMP